MGRHLGQSLSHSFSSNSVNSNRLATSNSCLNFLGSWVQHVNDFVSAIFAHPLHAVLKSLELVRSGNKGMTLAFLSDLIKGCLEPIRVTADLIFVDSDLNHVLLRIFLVVSDLECSNFPSRSLSWCWSCCHFVSDKLDSKHSGD